MRNPRVFPRSVGNAMRHVMMVLLLTTLGACAVQPHRSAPVISHGPIAPADVEFAVNEGPSAEQALADLLTKGRHPSLRHPDFTRVREPLRAAYALNNYAPRWLHDGQLNAEGKDVLDIIAASSSEGLDPRDYDLDWLNQQAESLQSQDTGGQTQARFELGLSIAFARFLHDLHAGRVAPRESGVKLDVSLREAEASHLIKRAFGDEAADRVYTAARPRFALYDRLKASLAHYRELAAKGNRSELPALEKSLKPGESWRGVPALARWLAFLGDYQGTRISSNTYSPALVSAVKQFQLRHGLADDGVIGRGTYTALTTPISQRVRQIELSMERMRWLSENLAGQRAIVVNIPQFLLWGFPGKTEASSLSMDVVVGQSVDHNTPVLLDEVETIIFNPYWNVPSSIAKKELLPKLRKDPTYLISQNMELVGGGQVLADVPTPELLDALARGEYRIRQRPGPGNALGRVKFEFPNNDAIYMHDTPSRGGFYQSRRDFSHGCIRLSHPERMANFLLSEEPRWDAKRISEAMSSPEQVTVHLREPVSVLLFYTTSIVDTDGKAVFLEDIYGQDSKLDQALFSADQRMRR